MDKRGILAAVAVSAVVGLIGGTAAVVWRNSANDRFAQCSGSAVAGGDIGGAFSLTDENGAAVTDVDIMTKPTLVYFGYTFCPDVCPTDSARNADAVDLLAAAGHDVTPIMITIDPERDTAAALRDFTDNFHPKMIGLTGTPEQIKAASLTYKTYFKKVEGDPKYYLMDHSTFTYLMLPKIGFVDFFDRDATAQDIAARTACFIENAP